MKKLIYVLLLIPFTRLAHAQVVTQLVTPATVKEATPADTISEAAVPAQNSAPLDAPSAAPAPAAVIPAPEATAQVAVPAARLPAQEAAPVSASTPVAVATTSAAETEAQVTAPAARLPAQEAAPVSAPAPVAAATTPASETKATPATSTDVAYGVKNPDFKIEPFAQLQGWAVYSMNRSAQNDADAGLDKADQRANFFFRRARLGFRGKPYKDLSYTVSLYYDNVGHDSMASTRGTTNPSTVNGRQTDVTRGVAAVGVWDSFLTWKVAKSDLFHVTGGYFRPQISRESLTAAFNVNSFEKAPSSNYVRQSVIGRNFGRATGLNAGGMRHSNGFGWRYDVGIFNKVKDTTGTSNGGTTLGETQGDENALVYVGRASMTFGDAEMEKYGFGTNINYFGKRKGVTVALNGSTQDRTFAYKENKVIGGDILFNYNNLNVDGEFFYIYKKNIDAQNYAKARTGHFRVGYNFVLPNGTVLEPTAMVSGFWGETGSDFTGRDTVYDAGVNWYLDQNKYKFFLHYVKQDGEGNNLVHKDGTNGFDYGDYVGLGLTLQI